MGSPPRRVRKAAPARDAEAIIRALGAAAIRGRVRKSSTPPGDAEFILAGAVAYDNLPAAEQEIVKKQLARTSAESRRRAKRALAAAMQAAGVSPTPTMQVRKSAEDASGELRISSRRRG